MLTERSNLVKVFKIGGCLQQHKQTVRFRQLSKDFSANPCFYRPMGKIDRRSRCFANSVKVLSGIQSGSHADCTPNTFQTFETRGKTSRPGDKEITQKRGDRGSGTDREPVSLKHFHCSQKKMVPEDQS